MQSYIMTCYRLRQQEALITLGSHRGGGGGVLNFCVYSTDLYPTAGEKMKTITTATDTVTRRVILQ